MPDNTSPPDLSRLKIDRSNSAPTPSRPTATRSLFVTAVLAGLVGFFFGSFGSDEKPESERPAESVQSPTNTPPPRPTNVLNATGYVVAQRKAAVSSKATGRLKELRVVEGDAVTEGQILGVLENDDLVAQVKELEASVVASDARLRAAKADDEDAQLNAKRLSALFSERVVSPQERDNASARAKRAAAEVSAAEAAVQLARAQLERAKVDLEYTLIRAPFQGTVLTKDADVGEIVAPFGSAADARAAIVTIADLGSLEVETDVSESNVAKIRVGTPAEITLDSFPEKRYRGSVVKIVPTVDRAKATVQAKVRFVEYDQNVLPEMSAKIAFQLDDSPS